MGKHKKHSKEEDEDDEPERRRHSHEKEKRKKHKHSKDEEDDPRKERKERERRRLSRDYDDDDEEERTRRFSTEYEESRKPKHRDSDEEDESRWERRPPKDEGKGKKKVRRRSSPDETEAPVPRHRRASFDEDDKEETAKYYRRTSKGDPERRGRKLSFEESKRRERRASGEKHMVDVELWDTEAFNRDAGHRGAEREYLERVRKDSKGFVDKREFHEMRRLPPNAVGTVPLPLHNKRDIMENDGVPMTQVHIPFPAPPKHPPPVAGLQPIEPIEKNHPGHHHERWYFFWPPGKGQPPKGGNANARDGSGAAGAQLGYSQGQGGVGSVPMQEMSRGPLTEDERQRQEMANRQLQLQLQQGRGFPGQGQTNATPTEPVRPPQSQRNLQNNAPIPIPVPVGYENARNTNNYNGYPPWNQTGYPPPLQQQEQDRLAPGQDKSKVAVPPSQQLERNPPSSAAVRSNMAPSQSEEVPPPAQEARRPMGRGFQGAPAPTPDPAKSATTQTSRLNARDPYWNDRQMTDNQYYETRVTELMPASRQYDSQGNLINGDRSQWEGPSHAVLSSVNFYDPRTHPSQIPSSARSGANRPRKKLKLQHFVDYLRKKHPDVCPTCGFGRYKKRVTTAGYLAAILLFPVGTFLCLTKRCCVVESCTYCGHFKQRRIL